MSDTTIPPLSRRWKICFVQPKASAYFFPESGIVGGGSERQVHLLSKELARHPQVEVHVCLADPGVRFAKEVEGVHLWRGVDLEGPRTLQIFRLRRTLKAIDADLYFFRSPDLGVAVGCALVSSLGKSFVYQLSSTVELMEGGMKQMCGRLGAMGMRYVYKKAKGILAQTLEQAERFEKNYNRKVLGVQPNMFLSPSLEEIPEQERSSVLWVGRCDPIKRGPLFIKLAQAFKDVPFVMICPPVRGWERLHRDWESLAEKVPNLKWIGKSCGGGLLWGYYQSARVLVMTSESEGYSNVMMEAWHAELPLVTTNINPDGLLTKNKMGRVGRWDGEDLSRCLEEVLKDSEEERAMGRRSKEFLENNHLASRCMVNLLEHLELLRNKDD